MIRKFIVAIMALVAACAYSQTETYSKQLADFTELTVADNINVVIKHTRDTINTAVFTCPKELAHVLTFSSKSGKLKIEAISDNVPEGACPEVTLYCFTLQKVTNWGDSTITVLSNNWGKEFKCKVIGNGNIVATDVAADKVEGAVETGSGRVYLSGSCRTAKYIIASAGAVEAGDMVAEKVSCKVFGTGDIDCHAEAELSVMGAGTGTVYYLGTPQVKKHTLGVKAVAIGNKAD